ncbi:hypothetical protein TPA0909_58900 [Streptomyces albus]|nr:hypothetical protein TPA0909_58900 [Streptomyces albus]
MAFPRLLILVPSVPSRRRARQQGVGLGEHGGAGAVPVVEAAGGGPRGLEMRELVLVDRDEVGLAEEDVRGLVDGIGEHQPADGGLARVGGLVLDRGIAAELGDGDEPWRRVRRCLRSCPAHSRVTGGHQRSGAGTALVQSPGNSCGAVPGGQYVTTTAPGCPAHREETGRASRYDSRAGGGVPRQDGCAPQTRWVGAERHQAHCWHISDLEDYP